MIHRYQKLMKVKFQEKPLEIGKMILKRKEKVLILNQISEKMIKEMLIF